MRVATLRYRANHPRGGDRFEQEHIELEIELDPDETPGEALRRARVFTAKAFGEAPLTDEEQRRAAALEL
jgi:hypothetical protein